MSWFGRPKKWHLIVDGVDRGCFRSKDEAYERLGEIGYGANYSIGEKIAGRFFAADFGYKCGTTTTADLAALGAPIHPALVNDGKSL